MKVLWVKSDFLHPTTKGGHIRTLGMLREMHRRHEIHYVAFEEGNAEGVRRSGEYSTRSYPIPFRMSRKGSLRFWTDVAASVFSPLPVHVTRPRSEAMRNQIVSLMQSIRFDALVCDFLTPVLNLPEMERWVLFQHNVEAMIWRRQAQHAPDPFRGWYLRTQAERLHRYEAEVCRTMRHVIAVSESDANVFRNDFAATRVSWVPTGVDIAYFTPNGHPLPSVPPSDLVFVGSMDWSPNVDGMEYFVQEILPLIRARKPDCTLTIVGREPSPALRKLSERDPLIRVTGTVPDVRPYLWSSRVSIVPLRIGGGTRLKIYESMAARTPVVSTSIGAEGLSGEHGREIALADTPRDFAAH